MEKSVINSPSWIVIIHALIELDTLERLIDLGQTSINSQLKELHEAMGEDYKRLTSENEEGDYLAHINDEYIEVTETLPCLYWYSQLLIGYSYFERTLDAFCMSLQKERGYKLSLKDIGGLGIIRAKTYLTKVVNLNSPFNLAEWQSANLFSEIRNSVAHRNGFIDYTPEDKRSLFYRLNEKGIELKAEIENQEDAQIILTRELVLESISAYRSIIKEMGGLEQSFITPKHGLPSGYGKI